ncbi:intracellular protein transport protein USO1-like [Tetranychus urticae]|uniref:intracellular protein transport protein USO1-like n=1 Tax=Tetranychus urticae TaxID=32264 RepID=UPI00077BF66F|nr:intracellular protein transport protein USO1-like [Tetranychus urticae]
MDLLGKVYEFAVKNNGERKDLEEITHSSAMDFFQAQCLRKNVESDVSCLLSERESFSMENFEELLTRVNFLFKEVEKLLKTHSMCILLKPVVTKEKKNLDEQMKKMKNELAHQLQNHDFFNGKGDRHATAAKLQDLENRVAAAKQLIETLEKEFFNRAVSNESKRRTIQRLKKQAESLKKIQKKYFAKDYKEEMDAAELNSKQLDEVIFARKYEHDAVYQNFERILQLKFNIDEIRIKIEGMVEQIQQKEHILKQERAEENRLTNQERLAEENSKQIAGALDSDMSQLRNHNQALNDSIKQYVHQIELTAQENKQLKFSSESIGSQIRLVEREFAAWKASLDNQSDESDDEMKDLESEIHELQTKLAEMKKAMSKSK